MGEAGKPNIVIQPIKNGKITSGYGMRKSPFNFAVNEMHRGIDIKPTDDLNVYCAIDSVVSYIDKTPVYDKSTNKGSFGNVVYTKMADGWFCIYPHMASINDNIKVGLELKAGNKIGIVGNTGLSAGVHLHFEIRNNMTVNSKSREPKEVSVLYL